MRRSSEEGYAVFRWAARVVTRHYRGLLVAWVLVFAGALVANQLWPVSDVISFEQTSTLPEDTESAQAQRIIGEQFPGQVANSTATIVLVANDTTTQYYRWFVTDFHDAIVVASRLGEGESVVLPLRIGSNVTIDRRIEFLDDPSSATIYGVYEAYAYDLAKELNGPVHLQVLFAQSAVGIYWGLPAYFVGAWLQSPPAIANDSAYAATRAYMDGALPADALPWATLSFDGFYQGWQTSFSNGSLASAPPDARADAVIAQTLPEFLSSPFGLAAWPPEQRLFQLGMLGLFRFADVLDPRLAERVETYALTALSSQVTAARLPFLQDLYRGLSQDATEAQLRAFSRVEVLAYDLNATPLVLPFNVTRYYLSEDRRILLMNYAFTKEAGYVDEAERQPVHEDVAILRDLAARMKAAYGAAAEIYVTGSAPSSVDQEEIFGGGAEFIATIVLVIILIGLYFRSVVSPAFPILTIGIALMMANLFVYSVAVYLFPVDFTVTAVLQTVLLATGTDYSIFLVSRYRDERRDGRDRKEAVRNAVIWAGESVTTSGGAVLISFFALSLGSFPFLKTMGLTMGFAVTAALGISLTFIPSVVMILGNRVFWPSGKEITRMRAKDRAHWTRTERYFHRAAVASMDHAKAVLTLAILITVPATYLVLTDLPTYDFNQGAPLTETQKGLDAISASFGYGFILPSAVVVQFPDAVLLPDGNVSVASMDGLHNLSRRLLDGDLGVKSVEGPTNPQGSDVDYRNLSEMPEAQRQLIVSTIAPYIGRDNRTVRIILVLEDPPFSREALSTVDRLKTELLEIRSTEPALAGTTVYLGGVSPVMNDVRHNLDRDLQIMAVVVITGLFIVLLFVLGSVLIPARAILTILLSISWTLGLTIVLFQVWKGIDIIFILPLALFVMAMGLGMDYDIFIITRVREEVAKGKPDRDAIAEATTRTGGIISACGIVMAGAFFTLMLSESPLLQEIGFALAFAILLDSMVVRIYLVPAIMVLAGKYNWWAPGRLQRVRRADKIPKRRIPASEVEILDEIDDI